MVGERGLVPWVVVGPNGVYWLGHAHNEKGAWTDALGWPDEDEVAEHKRAGWYAAEATVTWNRPNGVPTCGGPGQCAAICKRHPDLPRCGAEGRTTT